MKPKDVSPPVVWSEEEKRPSKAKLVSYSKQVLPKYIDEQPNEDNSPLLVMSPKGNATAEAKLLTSPRSGAGDAKDPKMRPVTAPPGTPLSARRSIFGVRSSGSIPATVEKVPSRSALPTSGASGSAPTSLMGASLTELALSARSSVPVLLNECFAWIRSSGALDHSGLFRGAGGDMDRIERIVNAFESQTREPHKILEKIAPADDDVCSLIKLFLRSLKDPVFTFDLFETWLSIVGSDLLPEKVVGLIGRLPTVHAEVLHAIATFLRELIVHGDTNGLSSTFLASAFGPLLLRPPDPNDLDKHRAAIVKLMQGILDNYTAIFFPSLSRSSDNTTQSTATDSTPRKSRKNPEKQPQPQHRLEASVDEFASLAKLVSKPAGPKTPEDSEEDRPESSSDEDDDGEDDEEPAARPAIMGRATVRVRASGPAAKTSSSSLVTQFNEKRAKLDPKTVAATADSGNASLTDVDTRVLRQHIDELREMSLSGSSAGGDSGAAADEETLEERNAKIEQIRAMLKADPRFRSQSSKVPSAKYEPPPPVLSSSGRHKKARRKRSKKKLDVGTPTVTATPPVASTVEGAKKRRPRICAKCKENVRGTKVNALGGVFHPACFVCEAPSCGEQLVTFFECGGQAFCEKHIQAAEEALVGGSDAQLCGRCGLAANSGTLVTALGKQWHGECFRCTTCNAPLETYFGKAGLPFCEVHVAAGLVRKKKKRSTRTRRAHSNPLLVDKKGSAIVAAAPVAAGDVEGEADESLQKMDDRGKSPKKQLRDSSHRSNSEKSSSGSAITASQAYSRFPRKQDPVFFFDKVKRRIARRWAVLQDQSLHLYKDESSLKRGKEALEVLDLRQLKRLSQLGVHQEKPFCLAFTIGYDTHLIWTEQLEYANWANAIVDSNPDGGVAIGTMEDFGK